ncbi:CHRD domain-containing protein [Oceanobacillus saliphilus]|uniref:CHRD domain-containing protein n=1 Tax=Oceanobacillus saliphilus TaxID=2925834 RepID=UPI00201E7381|nr:CHRD domain-containing protein [Oceanobacillus saliphilus]
MYNDYFFIADITGSQEAPPVYTDADGVAMFSVSSDQKKIRFRLEVNNLKDFLQATIHLGRRNISGPVVILLSTLNDQAIHSNKILIEGFLTAKDLIGPLKGKALSEFVDQMSAGKAYVNVHSMKHPDGEIRGKIKQQ